jgi:SAM-dependent methyltransferase
VLAFLRDPELGLDPDTTSFFDSGTGNGHFLFALRGDGGESDEEDGDRVEEEGRGVKGRWKGRMLGTDYSAASIEFARRIGAEKGFGGGEAGEIEFRHWDVINSPAEEALDGMQRDGWDVVLDKGTFDAISLSEERDARGRRICEAYKERIVRVLREGGLLVLTSCNWTEEELRGWFEDGEDGKLRFEKRIEYRSFSFGGKKGQTISSVAFRKGKKA